MTGTGAATRPAAPSTGPVESEIEVVLPASWWAVPLRDPAARERSVRALVTRQTGRADVRATLRHELRRDLLALTADAASRGGVLYAVSLLHVAGSPVSASLTTFRTSRMSGQTLAAVERRWRERGGDAARAEGPCGTVLRSVTDQSAEDPWAGRVVLQLVAEYWLDPDDGRGLFRAVFTTPHVDLRATMLPLFDAVVGSVGVRTLVDDGTVDVEDGDEADAEDQDAEDVAVDDAEAVAVGTPA